MKHKLTSKCGFDKKVSSIFGDTYVCYCGWEDVSFDLNAEKGMGMSKPYVTMQEGNPTSSNYSEEVRWDLNDVIDKLKAKLRAYEQRLQIEESKNIRLKRAWQELMRELS